MKRIIPLAVGYVGLAVLANWLASKYVWPVGFGLLAPAAGVLLTAGRRRFVPVAA